MARSESGDSASVAACTGVVRSPPNAASTAINGRAKRRLEAVLDGIMGSPRLVVRKRRATITPRPPLRVQCAHDAFGPRFDRD